MLWEAFSAIDGMQLLVLNAWDTFGSWYSFLAHAAAYIGQLLGNYKPRQVVAGLSILWAFCRVATGSALAQELDLH